MLTPPRLALPLFFLLANLPNLAGGAPSTRPAGLFVRVTLLSPDDRPWRLQLIAHQPAGKSNRLLAGQTIADAADANSAKSIQLLPPKQPTPWIDLSNVLTPSGATLRFLFETQPALEKSGVKATIDVATAADDSAILRSITEHDPANIIAMRIPANPSSDKSRILSIREDSQRRLDELKALHLPDGPRPPKSGA